MAASQPHRARAVNQRHIRRYRFEVGSNIGGDGERLDQAGESARKAFFLPAGKVAGSSTGTVNDNLFASTCSHNSVARLPIGVIFGPKSQPMTLA